MRSYLTSCWDSRRGFGCLDFEISLRSYLKSCRDSRRVFGRRDFEISWRSGTRISTRFWDLGENLGGFLAAEILRSRQDLVEDLDEILRSRWDLGENLGEFLAAEILRSRRDLAEISLRSRQSRRPKTRRDSRRDLGQNFAGVFAKDKSKCLQQKVCQDLFIKILHQCASSGCYHMQGKITDCWLAETEGIFS